VALSERWRIHAVLPRSRANGPGTRFTIWTQGCSLGCTGCFNPRTHAPDAAPARPVRELIDAVAAGADGIEGVTVTGGEPLEQPTAVAAFCRAVRARTALGIIVLTGFTRREIEADAARAAAVADVDLVVAGRYLARRRIAAGPNGLRGSENKTYWTRTARYRAADLAAVPDVELILDADGALTITGIPDEVGT
jgi:anaerobic ribonucleoside-triphosphate reductase activating protein